MTRLLAMQWLRAAEVILLAISSAAVAMLHAARSDLDPASHRLSEYAIGPYGTLMTTAFVACGAAAALLAAALWRANHRLLAPVGLLTAATGLMISAVYRTEPGATTQSEVVHSLASGVAVASLLVAAVAVTLMRRPPLIDRAVMITAVAAAGVSSLLHDTAWTGLAQRTLWLTLLAWLLRTAWAAEEPTGAGRREHRDQSVRRPVRR